MAERTGISWAHATWNGWLGCDKIAPECAHCYIDRVLLRQGREPWGQLYRTKTWNQPLGWQRNLAATGTAWRVFTCSLSDFFHAKADPWRKEAWDLIRATPNLVYLILTKRPDRIQRCLPDNFRRDFPNVWLGVSTGSRRTLHNMDYLREIEIHPDAVRWFSGEPLLEDICDNGLMPALDLERFGWAVIGGESGAGNEYLWDVNGNWRKEFDIGGRRYMRAQWAQRIQQRCGNRGIPFLFKQATDARSGGGSNLLGKIYHEFPNPPKGLVWAERIPVELQHTWTLAQIEAYNSRFPPV